MCHVPLYACGSTFLQRSSTPIHLPLYACGSIFLQHSPTPIHLSVPPPRRRVSNVSLSLCIVCQGRVINLASPAGSRSEVRGPGAESDGRRNKILVQARKGHSYGYLSLEFTDQMTLLWTDIIVTCHKLLCSRKINPSLIKYHYSGSTVVMDIRHLSLLWSLVAAGALTSSVRHY
jgi:hypothetical protein